MVLVVGGLFKWLMRGRGVVLLCVYCAICIDVLL